MLQVTVQINEEVHEQNRALEQMQMGMGAADNLLASTLGKIGVSDLTCYHAVHPNIRTNLNSKLTGITLLDEGGVAYTNTTCFL